MSKIQPFLPMPIHRWISVRFYTSAFVSVLLFSLCSQMATARAQSGPDRPVQRAATLSGRVLDASGNAAGGALVSVETREGATAVRVQADVAGKFLFPSLEPGSYTVRATCQGIESAQPVVVANASSHQQITIVLKPAVGTAAGLAPDTNSIDFVDKPNFTVAGVTDWTAVGGHGSDATLRTSEELNREALALRAQAPAGDAVAARSTGDAASESRLRAAVSASPQSYAANHDLGMFYLNNAQFTRAIPSLEAASRISGGQSTDEYNLALACRGSGDFASAQRHVQRALAQRETGESHRLAGELEEILGNPLAAVQHDARAAQLDPSEANYFAWGTELLLHRAIWQAADVFARASKSYPTSVRVKTAWGAALFAGASYGEAAETICEASSLDPSAREPYLFAGQIAMAAPSTSGCVGKTLERFLNLRPNDPQANYFYAMFLLKQSGGHAQDQARQLLLRAVALDPTCSDGFLQLGILSATRKDYPGAITYYLDALKADPHKGEAHYRLGVAYDRTGQPEKAKAEYALHEQIDTANAARVEQQRRDVKQFSIVTDAPAAVR